MEPDQIVIDRRGLGGEPDIRLRWERSSHRVPTMPGWICFREVEGRGWVRLQPMDARSDIRLGEQITAFVSHQLPNIMLIVLAGHMARMD